MASPLPSSRYLWSSSKDRSAVLFRVQLDSCHSIKFARVAVRWQLQPAEPSFGLIALQGPEKSELKRDFTYIDDIVDGIMGALAEIPPSEKGTAHYKVLQSEFPAMLLYAIPVQHKVSLPGEPFQLPVYTT